MRGILVFTAAFLACFVSIRSQNILIQALDSAMAMKSNFDSNAAFYRTYVNYEKESLSWKLAEAVAQAQERATTAAQGAIIQNCAVTSSYYATGLATPVLDHLYTIEDAALIYYRIVLDELTRLNVFNKDFEIFYSQFTERLNESYRRLNDELLQNVLDALFDLMDGSTVVYNTLQRCLEAV